MSLSFQAEGKTALTSFLQTASLAYITHPLDRI